MRFKVQLTEDGSHTVHSQQYGTTFHSHFGAIQESQVVFIRAGLQYFLQQQILPPDTPIRIVEMGLGTGLNTWLSLIESLDQECSIEYTALEKHPLPLHLVDTLNFPAIHRPEMEVSFRAIHEAAIGETSMLLPHFQLHKLNLDATNWHPGPERYHIVYYDAFGPATQPELWSASTLSAFVEALLPGGIFVTYCAKGEVRRTLDRLGLSMERLPGPPGKREMLRGTKR